MPRLIISGCHILSLDYKYREIYWLELSNYIRLKYGNGPFYEKEDVLVILKDCFHFLTAQFKTICAAKPKYSFWKYIFWLHEESISLYAKMLGGLKLEEISEDDFASYRRVLKAALEQGCDIDMEGEEAANKYVIEQYDEIIQRLFYVGAWVYSFADNIAYQNMLEDCYFIKFTATNTIVIDWKYHYGKAYHALFPQFLFDYEKGIVDRNAMADLRVAINDAFGIEYDFAIDLILEIKKKLNSEEWELQSIAVEDLYINLMNYSNVSRGVAENFYGGLTLDRENKMTIEEIVYKPYSLNRYMYRPIIIYKVKGKDRALVGQGKVKESMMVLSTNALQWNQVPKEWLSNKVIQDYINRKGQEHDKILEDKIEQILLLEKIGYCRNIKSFKRRHGNQININNSIAGEIDFIIIDKARKTVLIADAKYNRSKYEAVGYRIDYSNFIKEYEPKMTKKVNWSKNNLPIIQEHMEVIGKLKGENICDYKVEGIFLINTPTFYMFNGAYKTYTIHKFKEYIMGNFEFPTLTFEYKDFYIQVSHPYFKKPTAQNFLPK